MAKNDSSSHITHIIITTVLNCFILIVNAIAFFHKKKHERDFLIEEALNESAHEATNFTPHMNRQTFQPSSEKEIIEVIPVSQRYQTNPPSSEREIIQVFPVAERYQANPPSYVFTENEIGAIVEVHCDCPGECKTGHCRCRKANKKCSAKCHTKKATKCINHN